MWPDDLPQQIEQIREESDQEQELAAFGHIPHFGWILMHLQHRQQYGMLAPCDPNTPANLAIGAAFALVQLAATWALPNIPEHTEGQGTSGLPWPPPYDLCMAAYRVWASPGHHLDDSTPEQRRLRALEFVVAFLLGWHRQPEYVSAAALPPAASGAVARDCPTPPILVNPSAPGNDWLGVSRGARNLLNGQDQVASLVWCHFTNLADQHGGIPGVGRYQPQPWLFHALNRFLWQVISPGDGCGCGDKYLTESGSGDRWDEWVEQAPHCAACHSVRLWNPRTASFWEFARRGVLGFQDNPADLGNQPDPVARVQPRNFIRGLLHAALWAGAPDHDPLFLVVHHHFFRNCPHCGWTIRMQCHAPHFERQGGVLRPADWLLLNTQDRFDSPPAQPTPSQSGYQWRQGSACHNGHVQVAEPLQVHCPGCNLPVDGRHVVAGYVVAEWAENAPGDRPSPKRGSRRPRTVARKGRKQ
jgi:hypothetical protein